MNRSAEDSRRSLVPLALPEKPALSAKELWLEAKRAEHARSLARRKRDLATDSRAPVATTTAATTPPPARSWSLDFALTSEAGIAALRKFCAEELSEESIGFVIDASAWKAEWGSSDEAARRAGADAIISTYLTAGAENELCVPTSARFPKGFSGSLDALTRDMFDYPLEHAQSTLLLDIWPRFEDTSEGKALRKALLGGGPEEVPAPKVTEPAAATRGGARATEERQSSAGRKSAKVAPMAIAADTGAAMQVAGAALQVAAGVAAAGARVATTLSRGIFHGRYLGETDLSRWAGPYAALQPRWAQVCMGRTAYAVRTSACLAFVAIAGDVAIMLLDEDRLGGSKPLRRFEQSDWVTTLLPQVVALACCLLALLLTPLLLKRHRRKEDRVFEISVAVLLALPPLLVGLAHSPVYLIKGGGRHAAGRGAAYATFGAALLCGTMHRATAAGLPTALIFIGVSVESWLAWAEVPAPAKSAAEFRIDRYSPSYALPALHTACLLLLGVMLYLNARRREQKTRLEVLLRFELDCAAQTSAQLLVDLYAPLPDAVSSDPARRLLEHPAAKEALRDVEVVPPWTSRMEMNVQKARSAVANALRAAETPHARRLEHVAVICCRVHGSAPKAKLTMQPPLHARETRAAELVKESGEIIELLIKTATEGTGHWAVVEAAGQELLLVSGLKKPCESAKAAAAAGAKLSLALFKAIGNVGDGRGRMSMGLGVGPVLAGLTPARAVPKHVVVGQCVEMARSSALLRPPGLVYADEATRELAPSHAWWPKWHIAPPLPAQQRGDDSMMTMWTFGEEGESPLVSPRTPSAPPSPPPSPAGPTKVAWGEPDGGADSKGAGHDAKPRPSSVTHVQRLSLAVLRDDDDEPSAGREERRRPNAPSMKSSRITLQATAPCGPAGLAFKSRSLEQGFQERIAPVERKATSNLGKAALCLLLLWGGFEGLVTASGAGRYGRYTWAYPVVGGAAVGLCLLFVCLVNTDASWRALPRRLTTSLFIITLCALATECVLQRDAEFDTAAPLLALLLALVGLSPALPAVWSAFTILLALGFIQGGALGLVTHLKPFTFAPQALAVGALAMVCFGQGTVAEAQERLCHALFTAINSQEKQNGNLLRASLPAPLVEALLESCAPLIAHSSATAVVARPVGLTDLIGDAQKASELMAKVVDAWEAACAANGCLAVRDTISDTLIAVSGISSVGSTRTPNDRHPEQACGAALAAVEDVSRLAAEMGVAVSLRAGIHTGEMTSGILGIARFGAWGDAVTHADRLQRACPPGGVLASQDTADALALPDVPRFRATASGDEGVEGAAGGARTYVVGAVRRIQS